MWDTNRVHVCSLFTIIWDKGHCLLRGLEQCPTISSRQHYMLRVDKSWGSDLRLGEVIHMAFSTELLEYNSLLESR